MWWTLLACVSSPPAPPPPVEAPPPAAPGPSYDTVRAYLEADRQVLASFPRAEARALARRRLLEAFRDELVPFWLGTPWDFYGTTQTPGEGHIACGYFVSTVLQHSGLRVERVRMAQQASEYILKTFSGERDLKRFRSRPAAEVVDWVRDRDDGLYIVGLDYHVGVLVKQGDHVEFCHSAYSGVTAVDCADPLTDPGFVSRYRVVGPVLTDTVVDAWLDGTELITFQPG